MKDPVNKNKCPICGNLSEYIERYANYVCKNCTAIATDFDGELLEFFNLDMGGGYQSNYKNSKQIYDSHVCYINGIKCYADEARFGGIVVKLFNNDVDTNSRQNTVESNKEIEITLKMKTYYISKRFFTNDEFSNFKKTFGYEITIISYTSTGGEIDFCNKIEKDFLLENGHPRILDRFFN